VPGRDITGKARPLGLKWDMGAYESLGVQDIDGDGMGDVWEQAIVNANPEDSIASIADVLPNDDFDGDGKTNFQEWQEGTDPTTKVAVAITSPVERPHYVGNATTTLTMAGTSSAADLVRLEINKGAAGEQVINATPTAGGDYAYSTWQAGGISLNPGQNLITVIAESETESPATKKLTVIRDAANPAITVLDPVYDGYFPTTDPEIHISGIATDDTQVTLVRWSSISQTGQTANGNATGTTSWDTGPIPLEEDETHDITITVEDRFGNSSSVVVHVRQEPGVGPISEPPVIPQYKDPLDFDEDKYLNADESACMGNDSPAPRDPAVHPLNVGDTMYPADPAHPHYNPAKVGYYWPDCLNPDDDEDGLPDWWEQTYFGSTTAATPTGNPDGDAFDNRDHV